VAKLRVGGQSFGIDLETSASQTLAGEIDAMGVVNEVIKDSIGISRVANERMPFIDGDLAGEDRGAAP
jgi:hypothetical protein